MGTLSGTVKDSAGDPAARTVRAYRRDTGVLLGSASSAARTAVDADSHFSNVSLQIDGNGINNSVDILDTSPSPKPLSLYGNIKISTAQSAFAGSSIVMDGDGDYITTPQSAAFDFGTGDFTVELFYRPAGTATDQQLLSYGNSVISAGTDLGWGLGFFGAALSGATRFFFYSGSDGYTVDATTPLSVNTWVHIAGVRSGSDLKIFIGGSLASTTSGVAASVNNPTSRFLALGRYAEATPRYPAGNVQAVRITKGVARYSANFTPPSAPLPGAGIAANTLGDFTLDTGSYSGACTVVCLDADGGDANALVFDRVTPA